MSKEQRSEPTPQGGRHAASGWSPRRVAGATLAAVTLGALAPSALLAGSASAATAGTFSASGSLVTARADAAMVTLADGQVLVAGGQDASGNPLADAELYNPTTGTWAATQALPLPLTDATATRLAGGDVLVAGGLTLAGGTLQATAATELFNPGNGTWSTTGTLPAASYQAAAVLLSSSGDVLYAGGMTGTGASAATTSTSAVYDPATNKWTPTAGQLTLGVSGAAAGLLQNGEVLLAGGESQVKGGAASVTSEAELYQPSSGTWSATATMPAGVVGATSTVLGNGDLLVAGGRTTATGNPTASSELFVPSTSSWSATGNLPVATYGASASLLSSGEVLYSGGMVSSSGSPTDVAAVYAPSSGQWSPTGSLLLARAGASQVVLSDGNVLVAGGELASGVTAESELYTPQPPNVAPAITSASTLYIHAGTAMKFSVTTTGSPSPTLSESGTLPPGLAFATSGAGTATISGTPGASATIRYAVTIVATNGVGSPAIQRLQLLYTTVPRITTRPGLRIETGKSLNWTLRSAGSPTPTMSESGTLPPGIAFRPGPGGTSSLVGTVPAGSAGSYVFTLSASNGVGTPATQAFHFVVFAPAPPAPPSTTTTTTTVPAVPRSSLGIGYLYVTSTGELLAKGDTSMVPPVTGYRPRGVVATATTADDRGYYFATGSGGVFNYGDARWFGSNAHRKVGSPTVAFALTPSGGGYDLVTRAGNVFGFGNAGWYGSPVHNRPRLTSPVVAFALTPDGRGYWVVTARGNVFAYGDAHWFGSPAHQKVGKIVAFARTPDARGYWLVTSAGDVISYGDAHYYGGLQGRVPPVVAFSTTLDGRGYWIVSSMGNVFNFGDARFFGSSAHTQISGPVKDFVPLF